MPDKMPPKARMLTMEEVQELKKEPLLVHMQDADLIVETLEAALTVVEAAKGLSHERDWNEGTHAIVHGYREQLLKALEPFRRDGE